MVRLTQNVEAAFEVETSYSDPADSSLTHIGLLDTFDPRAVAMNITPVPSIGQSTDAHHAAGPIDVTLPLKVACQGTGWKQLFGRAIGATDLDDGGGGTTLVPHKLTNSVSSLAILAKETGVGYTLATGVVPNEVTLEADFTTGGYMTVDAACTAFYSQDSAANDLDFSNDDGLLIDNYSDVTFPSAPTDEPLLPSDLTISYAKTSDLESSLNIDGPAGSYIEIGERYIKTYLTDGTLDTDVTAGGAVTAVGVIDMTNAAADKLEDLDALFGTSSGAGKDGWTVTNNTNDSLSVNLLKGIYSTDTARTISGVNTAVTTGVLPQTFDNLKTVALKIANNNTSIPGKVTRGDGSPAVTKWLQNANVGRGKSDITLDLTMTAENEDLYDIYAAGGVIPLIRLDLGTSGSIALTNGTITSFSRPLTGGGEVVDSVSIKFRGAGDIKDYSSLAISADWTL